MGITKSEIKAIFGMFIFGIVWMIAIANYISKSSWFLDLSPPYQFVLFNLGYMLLITSIFGTLLNIFRKKEGFVNVIINGFAGFILFAFVFDLYAPPYAWAFVGEGVVDATGEGMLKTSSDYLVGWLWQQVGFTTDKLFGLFPISSVYILTYVFTPIFVVVLISLVLEPKQTINFVVGGMSAPVNVVKNVKKE